MTSNEDLAHRLTMEFRKSAPAPPAHLIESVLRATGEVSPLPRRRSPLYAIASALLPAAAAIGVVVAVLWLRSASESLPGGRGSSEVVQQASGGGYTLSLHVGRSGYRVNEPIAVYALLTYTGSDASVTPWGSRSGIVGFGLSNSDGVSLPPGYLDDCRAHPALQRDHPLRVEFRKSGAYSEGDPNAAFLRSYLADQELRLPAGTWTITAETNFRPGGCIDVRPVLLNAAATIIVAP